MTHAPETTDGWLDMATAPRDGTPILALKDLNNGSYEHVVVWWSSRDLDYPWAAGDDDGYPIGRLAYWQPLPGLPEHAT